jgi:hypothetical protein
MSIVSRMGRVQVADSSLKNSVNPVITFLFTIFS